MVFKESEVVELKSKVNDTFMKEVVAFANGVGGCIYVGVEDDGAVVGVSDIEKVEESIGNSIRDAIRPDLIPYTKISTMQADGKNILKIEVQSGPRKPYHLGKKGLKPSGVYVRHGTASVPATEESIRTMIRDSDGIVFEQMRSLEQDLTFNFTSSYFSGQGISFQENHQKTLGFVDKDDFYTNLGLLFSDQCGHIIRCAVYQDETKNVFQARKEFQGSILKQLEDAYEFLDLLNLKGSRFEKLKRIDFRQYEPQALKEALLNAIVHRDYDFSGPIILHIYTNRIEFVSLGGLDKGLTKEDLFNGASQSRNPKIASVFFRLDLVESYGSGISRIRASYDHLELKPDFITSPASFVTILPNRTYYLERESDKSGENP